MSNRLKSDLLTIATEKKAKRAAELVIAEEEKAKREAELVIAETDKAKRAAELVIAEEEKAKREAELVIAKEEKGKRAAELVIAEEEKAKRADELVIAKKEKAERITKSIIADKELSFQTEEKSKRASELIIANEEKDKRADELIIANEEKDKRADELIIANKELVFQNREKEKRADELILANKELAFQNEEKAKRAEELILANKELAYQNREKDKRASELIIANEEKDKRADELILANKELAYQNREKEKRADELIIVNKEQEAFSYSVSHDLRAPLRHINGYVDLLLSRFYDSLPEKARHYLDTIADSSHQMGALIDTLLQFSRIGRQEKRFTDFDMNIVVNEVLVEIKHYNSERNIEWRIASLPHVYADKTMLELVWTNLLSNAVKFTSKRKKAIIGINVLDENDEFIFTVHDNGVGFDMQYAHKLFGVFQRLHSTDEFEGIGIGLANVQRIISRHGGRTWAKAEPDKGATFYFSLPKNKEN
jgi:signal transduction histidine kinase